MKTSEGLISPVPQSGWWVVERFFSGIISTISDKSTEFREGKWLATLQTDTLFFGLTHTSLTST